MSLSLDSGYTFLGRNTTYVTVHGGRARYWHVSLLVVPAALLVKEVSTSILHFNVTIFLTEIRE